MGHFPRSQQDRPLGADLLRFPAENLAGGGRSSQTLRRKPCGPVSGWLRSAPAEPAETDRRVPGPPDSSARPPPPAEAGPGPPLPVSERSSRQDGPDRPRGCPDRRRCARSRERPLPAESSRAPGPGAPSRPGRRRRGNDVPWRAGPWESWTGSGGAASAAAELANASTNQHRRHRCRRRKGQPFQGIQESGGAE